MDQPAGLPPRAAQRGRCRMDGNRAHCVGWVLWGRLLQRRGAVPPVSWRERAQLPFGNAHGSIGWLVCVAALSSLNGACAPDALEFSSSSDAGDDARGDGSTADSGTDAPVPCGWDRNVVFSDEFQVPPTSAEVS